MTCKVGTNNRCSIRFSRRWCHDLRQKEARHSLTCGLVHDLVADNNPVRDRWFTPRAMQGRRRKHLEGEAVGRSRHLKNTQRLCTPALKNREAFAADEDESRA